MFQQFSQENKVTSVLPKENVAIGRRRAKRNSTPKLTTRLSEDTRGYTASDFKRRKEKLFTKF